MSKTNRLILELVKTRIANSETEIANYLYFAEHMTVNEQYNNHMDVVKRIRDCKNWDELIQIMDNEFGMDCSEFIQTYLSDVED